MQSVEITYLIYTHYTEGVYSDFRGCAISTGAFIALKDIPALFIHYNISNAKFINNKLEHIKGTKRFYNITMDSFKKKNTNSIQISEVPLYIKNLKPRFCFTALCNAFMQDDARITALYGVQRTGKTVLMHQVEQEVQKRGYATAFLTCTPDMLMSDIDLWLNQALSQGIKFVFIDEITFISNFLTGSYHLSNEFAAHMHIMIAGTNSFQIRVACSDVLYDRVKLFPVTYISYAEYNTVLGDNFKTYLRCGGLMYNNFKTYSDTHEFEVTAIIENFNSVFYDMQFCRRNQSLYQAYCNGSLQWYINRVLESNAEAILTQTFKSFRLGSALELLSKAGITVNEEDLVGVLDAFKYKLHCREQIPVEEELIKQVYNLLSAIEVYYYSKTEKFITIPGLVYSITLELLATLAEEVRKNIKITSSLYTALSTKIIQDVEGILIENTVFYNTLKALENVLYTIPNTCATNQKYKILKYSNAYGEFNLVILNNLTYIADLYEIKRSVKRTSEQVKHLVDSQFLNFFETDMQCKIGKRTVLYNGENATETINGVTIYYKNIESYLLNINKYYN